MAEPERTQEMEKYVQDMVTTIGDIVIRDSETLSIADKYSRDVREAIKRVKEYFDPTIEAANKTHKMLTGKRREVLAPLESLLKSIDGKITEYARVEEERRRVEQEKARKIAEKEEEDRRLALAEEADREGDKELANEILDAVLTTPSVSVGPPPIKTEIKGLFDHWTIETIDLPVLAKAWLSGLVPPAAIIPNEKFIGARVRADKENFFMPGVKVRCEKRRRG